MSIKGACTSNDTSWETVINGHHMYMYSYVFGDHKLAPFLTVSKKEVILNNNALLLASYIHPGYVLMRNHV